MKLVENMSLKAKIIAIVFAILSLVFVICYFFFNYAFHIYNQTIYVNKAGEIKANTFLIEEEFRAVEALSEEYMTQIALQDNLQLWSSSASAYETNVSANALREYMSRLATRKKYMKAVILEDANGQSIVWDRDSSLNKSFFERMLQNGASIREDGSNYWIEPEEGSLLFTSVRSIRRIRDNSFVPIGKLYIVIDADRLIANTFSNSQSQITNLSICGEKGVYSYGEFDDKEVLNEFLSENMNYGLKTSDGVEYFLVRLSSGYTHYDYVAAMDFGMIFSNIVRFNALFITFFALLFVGLLLLSVWLSRKLVSRVETLCGSMNELAKGNFEIKNTISFNENSKDEIEILTKHFYDMAGQIDTLIKENYEKVILLKESQLKILHSQIKPHFLYNTLETINWMALSEGQKEISMMVKALGNLLRGSIDQNQFVISIQEELRFVKDYILIQKNRFEKALDVTVDVPEQLCHYSMLKMSLQILVENSIKHTIEKTGNYCKIEISIAKEGDELIICVSDNGPGISDEIIKKIKEGKYSSERGIGLENIEKRIKLIYGERYGLTICNRPEGGASVVIKIPAKEVNFIKKLYAEEGKDAL